MIPLPNASAAHPVWLHVGELLDGKPTNHLDLRKNLAKGKAKPYLYYTVSR